MDSSMEAIRPRSPSTGTPAPYGRACTTCARAKAKCVYQDDVSKCKRCMRLSKECQPSPSVRGSRIMRKPNTKTARLEAKLDELVTLLTAASQPQAGQPPTAGQLSASAALAQFGASPRSLDSRVESPRNHNEPADGSFSPGHRRVDQDLDRAGVCSSAPHNVYITGMKITEAEGGAKFSSSAQQYQMSALFSDEAEECFELFRTKMLPYFPFMVLPKDMTMHELRTKKPFLWLCIMTFTTKSSTRRRILGLETRQTIGTKIIVEGERSIDLLQGLLLYAGWGQFYVFCSPIMTNVTQLAIGMLGDLGLRRPPPKESPCMMLEYDARGNPKPFLPAERTLEDRRIAISCWSASQAVSLYFQKVDPMRWLPYYDESLRLLTESEHLADTLLVQIVRLQLIREKVIHAPWHDTAETARAPAVFYIKVLQNELTQARERWPEELQQAETLLFYSYDAEVSIHEIALSKNLDSDFQRLDSLWVALQAIKNWFDLFLRFQPLEYIGLPMALLSQLAHCMVTLSRLSSYEHPDWDLKLVRGSCSFSFLLDELIERFSRVKLDANLDAGTEDDLDTFSITARRLTGIRQWWNAKLETEQSDSNDKQAAYDSVNDPMFAGPIDFSDDTWLRDMLSLDDSQFNQIMH